MTLTVRLVLVLFICALIAGGCGAPYKKERLTDQRGWRFGPYNTAISPLYDVDSLGHTDANHVHGLIFRTAPNRIQKHDDDTTRLALELGSIIIHVRNQQPRLLPPSALRSSVESQATENHAIEYRVAFDTSYSYNDLDLVSYRLRLVDQTSGKVVDSILADEYCGVGLKQKYPGPFSPNTEISFIMPMTDKYVLTIYDIYGKKVDSLKGAGNKGELISFDWDASGFDSGVYFYKLEVADFTDTRKMVLMK